MSRSMLKAAAALALTTALIASPLAAAPAKPATLSVTYATGDILGKEALHNMIDQFQKATPSVKIQENLSVSTGAYLDSLKMMNAGGQLPDFFECRDTAVFVRAGLLAPLPKEVLALMDSPIPVYGTVYTAPIATVGTNGIIYNKKFFKDHGFSASPKTYGEFLQLCEKIKATGTAPLVAGIADIWHSGFWFGKFWVDNIGTKNPNWIADRYAGKVHFSDPDFAKGIAQMIDLFRKGYVEGGFMSTKESQCVSVLVSGKAAMYYVGSFVFPQIVEADPSFEFGWFPLPDDQGKIKLMGGSTPAGWAITTEAAKDPAKVQAFVTFCKYFYDKRNYGPYLKATSAFSTTKEPVTYELTGPNADMLAAYVRAPKSLNWNQGIGANEMPSAFRNWTYKKIQEGMLGLASAEDITKAMDAEWEVETRDFNPSALKAAPLVK
jgi:raffinose/stachyose/melibiose transport system substrate-binding protein